MLKFGLTICFSITIYLTLNLLLTIASYDKEVKFVFSEREKRLWQVLCLVNGILLGCLIFQEPSTFASAGGEMRADVRQLLLLSVFSGCLLMACVTDKRFCRVYNFTWWLGGGAGLLLLLLYILERKRTLHGTMELLFPLLVFGLLQELFFCRLYGRADSHAFLTCSMVECALGMGMKEYLLHMLLAFGLLAVVQMLRHNIGRDGNLKQPIAFLPYITIAFWGQIIAGICCMREGLVDGYFVYLLEHY